jgi:predicted MFS family arabinose efflux permease
MAKILVVIGLAIAAAGVAMWLGLPLGRLPGDIVLRRGAFSFALPMTTCVLLSVVITVVLALIRR